MIHRNLSVRLSPEMHVRFQLFASRHGFTCSLLAAKILEYMMERFSGELPDEVLEACRIEARVQAEVKERGKRKYESA